MLKQLWIGLLVGFIAYGASGASVQSQPSAANAQKIGRVALVQEFVREVEVINRLQVTAALELSKNIRCFSNMRRLPSSASSSDSAISERWPVSNASLTITRWRAIWTVNSAICRLACARYF